jgi:hypothetical protein
MSACTNHGKTTSAKRNSELKSTFTERDRRTLRRIVSKNQRTTAAHVRGQQNWIFILKTLFPQKLSDVSFTNATSTVGLQLLNLWLLKVMPRWCHDIKPGHQTTGNAWYGQMSRPSRCSPHQEEFTFGEQPRSLQSGMPSSNNETRGKFRDCLGSNIVVEYSIIPIITIRGQITAREYVDRLSNQVHPMIQTLFPSEERCSFPRWHCLHSHSWNCSVMVWRTWRRTSTSSLASTITTFEHHWTTLVSFGD